MSLPCMLLLLLQTFLQRKGKGKKGAGRRDIDKLAKQEQRMIKNRESAARSRLRRQQHTAQLEQANEELKGQVAALTEKVCAEVQCAVKQVLATFLLVCVRCWIRAKAVFKQYKLCSPCMFVLLLLRVHMFVQGVPLAGVMLTGLEVSVLNMYCDTGMGARDS